MPTVSYGHTSSAGVQLLRRSKPPWVMEWRPSNTNESSVMEDLSVTLKALVLLVVVLALLIGTLVASPTALGMLAVVLSWLGLAGVLAISRI